MKRPALRLEHAAKPRGTDASAQLLSWLRGFGRLYAVGVEGTGSYGAGLARHLAGEGVTVVEINRADRRQRRMKGKSDPLDAHAAAEAVLSGRACATPKLGTGIVEAIRALHGSRASAVKARTNGSRSTSRKSPQRSIWASATSSSKASIPRSDSSTPAATDTTAPKR